MSMSYILAKTKGLIEMRLPENPFKHWLAASFLVSTMLCPLLVSAAETGDNLAFPEKFMLRVGSYSVQDADTDIAVFSSGGVGTGFSFARDLGGDESVTTPRLDAYYRFNSNHRIDFSSFQYKRDGRQLLEIEIELEDQTYSVGETVVSDIDFDLFKIAYGYTFYHSSQVEIGVTAGLNVTRYDFSYERDDGTKADTSDVTAPLPMFGVRISYAINPRWSVHYLSESFYIELGDELTGAFTTNELNLQYRLSDSFLVGGGLSRFSTDFEADDDDWKGRIADTHRGVLFYLSYSI